MVAVAEITSMFRNTQLCSNHHNTRGVFSGLIVRAIFRPLIQVNNLIDTKLSFCLFLFQSYQSSISTTHTALDLKHSFRIRLANQNHSFQVYTCNICVRFNEVSYDESDQDSVLRVACSFEGNLRPRRCACIKSKSTIGFDFHLIVVHTDSGIGQRDLNNRNRVLDRLNDVSAALLATDRDIVINGDYNTMETGTITASTELSEFSTTRELSVQTASIQGYCKMDNCDRLNDMPIAYYALSDHCPVVIVFANTDMD
jgi:hypothetical protein